MAPPQKSSFKINDESAPEGKWNGKYDDFKTLGENLDIKTFSNSAGPFGDAQGLLITTYEELSTQAYRLADMWQGKTAAEFQKNLKALYESACALADATGKVNVAIGYHASDLQTLQENVDKMKPDTSKSAGDWFFGDSYDPLGISHRTTDVEEHQNQANQQVQDWINKDLTNNTTSYTFTELPKDVHLELPNPTPGAYNPEKTPGGPNGPGGIHNPGGSTPNLTSPSSHPTPPGSHFTPPNTHLTDPTHHPTDPTHHTTVTDPGSVGTGVGSDLAGLSTHTPGGGPGLSDGLSGGGGGGGGGLGGGLTGPGSHGGLGGSSGLGGGGLGGPGSGVGPAAGAGKAGASGGMPMGMGGGAGGGQEQERERTTWLTEDEDVWGGDGDVAPPVIG